MAPKKGKKDKGPPKVDLVGALKNAPPPKPKKIPPPPKCFGPDDLARFKELYKEFDEDNTDRVPLAAIPVMLRKLGFNPKGEEVEQLFAQFLEDDMVDTVEYHEWLQMIEAKIAMGDDIEAIVTEAMGVLGHDEEKQKIVDLDLLKTELMTWGEPLEEIEFRDWIKLATKDKTYDVSSGGFGYEKFIENMNAKDNRFFAEPINFFKLDQKTLAAMAIVKAAEEKAEAEKREAERLAKEEQKRQRMIAQGLILEDQEPTTPVPPAPAPPAPVPPAPVPPVSVEEKVSAS